MTALLRRLARLVPASALATLALLAAPALAAPTAVTLDVSIDNGSWIPLPADAMQAATADAALARISEGGWLRVVPSDASGIEGSLAVAVSLVEKAQIAKAVLTLAVPGEATYVAAASISVRGLDGQGFHRAFEHVGREAADRLHSMMAARRGGPIEIVDDADDTHWRDTFNTAQQEKHAGGWAEARVLFEQVAAASGPGTSRLAQMAHDELRYGLPVMEARQTLVGMGGPGGAGDFATSLARVEGLYRQIQAENPTNVARIQEAQQALDQAAVMRNAWEQARRSQVVMRVHEVRMMLTELVYMEGACPDAAAFDRVLSQSTFELEAGPVTRGADGTTRYSIVDAESGIGVPATCDPRRGVQLDLNGVAPTPARHGR